MRFGELLGIREADVDLVVRRECLFDQDGPATKARRPRVRLTRYRSVNRAVSLWHWV
jgi:hypothetical protein